MAGDWIAHVKKYQAAHPGMSYKDALKGAKSTYKKVQGNGFIEDIAKGAVRGFNNQVKLAQEDMKARREYAKNHKEFGDRFGYALKQGFTQPVRASVQTGKDLGSVFKNLYVEEKKVAKKNKQNGGMHYSPDVHGVFIRK